MTLNEGKENEKHISIPLPIILWTDNGLVSFLSSEFHHDDEEKKVVTKKGQSFVKFHEEIYYANTEPNSFGQYVILDQDGHPTNDSPLDFSITKLVFSMFLSMLLLVLIFGISARNYSKSDNGVPSGIAKFTEPLILFIRDEVAIPNIGEKNYKKYMPYLLTLFFFIWINNLMGLSTPYSTEYEVSLLVLGFNHLFYHTIYCQQKLLGTHFLDARSACSYENYFIAQLRS